MKTYSDYMLALGMLITGSINTISTKIADEANATGTCKGSTFAWSLDQGYTNNTSCEPRPFNHPFLQAVGMFIGEGLVLIVFYLSEFWFKYRDNKALSKPDDYSAVEDGANGASEGGEKDSQDKNNWSPIIFLLPACCDLSGT